MNKKQRERMAALSCDLVKLPLGSAVLYPIFQENTVAAIVFFGLATSLWPYFWSLTMIEMNAVAWTLAIFFTTVCALVLLVKYLNHKDHKKEKVGSGLDS